MWWFYVKTYSVIFLLNASIVITNQIKFNYSANSSLIDESEIFSLIRPSRAAELETHLYFEPGFQIISLLYGKAFSLQPGLAKSGLNFGNRVIKIFCNLDILKKDYSRKNIILVIHLKPSPFLLAVISKYGLELVTMRLLCFKI